MKLDSELLLEIKKYAMKGEAAAKNNEQRLLVSLNTFIMTLAGFLRQIGGEFEKVNKNLERLGNELDFIRKKMNGGE